MMGSNQNRLSLSMSHDNDDKNKGDTIEMRNGAGESKSRWPRVRNSYLKVMLDDSLYQSLHDLSVSIREDIIQANFVATDRRLPFLFQPRSLSSLHMTFFFGGQVLTSLPPEELREWHEQLTTRFHNVVGGDDYTVTLRELTLFPPRRHSLIVAIFDVSPSMNILHDDVRDMAQKSNSTLLSNVVQRSKQQWTAHITLGNVRGATQADSKRLQNLLIHDDTLQQRINDLSKSATVRGIQMGGPCPDQYPLDWTFPFHP